MKILNTLTNNLEGDTRRQIFRRYDAFIRQLEYLKSQNDQKIIILREDGWSDNKFKVIFALNSFYQEVIGPLSSSAQSDRATGLGSQIPIVYGSMVKFTSSRSNKIQEAYNDFIQLAYDLDITDMATLSQLDQ